MKKRLLAAALSALLLLPMGGVVLAEDNTASASTPVAQETAFLPGSVPSETSTLDAMTPAIHAAVLAMLHRDVTVFRANDTELGWETLYNMLSLYGQMDERADYVGEDLILPVESVQDFSTALFPSLDALGPIPSDLADRMVYASEIDSYRLVCGNDSLAQIQLTSSTRSGNTLELTGALVYLVDGSDLAQFHATLQVRDNLFGYTIVALELV
jgi:hypothetical protein